MSKLTSESNAYSELMEYLNKDELVEAIIFGEWGWEGYNEPTPNIVNHNLFGEILSIDEAKPLLERFSFLGGFGSPNCYAVRIFTNQRIIWVTQYDGSTTLDGTIIKPTKGYIPDMPGS